MDTVTNITISVSGIFHVDWEPDDRSLQLNRQASVKKYTDMLKKELSEHYPNARFRIRCKSLDDLRPDLDECDIEFEEGAAPKGYDDRKVLQEVYDTVDHVIERTWVDGEWLVYEPVPDGKEDSKPQG
jgi:hypothetical protein